MKNYLLATLMALLIGLQLFGQSPTIEWERTFDGAASAFDEVKYIRLDSNQDVIVTGRSNGGTTMADVVTRKYDPSGNLLWSHTYNNSDYNRIDVPLDMELTSNGNVVIVGRTFTSDGFQPNSIGFIYMLFICLTAQMEHKFG